MLHRFLKPLLTTFAALALIFAPVSGLVDRAFGGDGSHVHFDHSWHGAEDGEHLHHDDHHDEDKSSTVELAHQDSGTPVQHDHVHFTPMVAAVELTLAVPHFPQTYLTASVQTRRGMAFSPPSRPPQA